MPTVPVQLPAPAAPAYDVRIEPGLIDHLGVLVRAVAPAPSCVLITDTHVAPLYLARAKNSLESANYRVIEHLIPAGEAHKTVATVASVWDAVLSAKIERATPVIALGGGVVGDLAGFVAASVLRGVPFIQVPTTLLAAVDASVGGKVGVDHPAGKNLIGAFHQPRLVATDIATFKTLPPRELQCGLAECIKHGVIRDRALFDFLAANAPKILAQDLATLAELVAWNVRIKATIIGEDPYERGVRALLNLGHTFGHAIETVTGYGQAVQHGEGVALGMIAAARTAVALNRFTNADLARLLQLITLVGLPTSLPTLNVDQTFAAMATDKKVRAGKLRLVLPTSLGTAEVFDNVDDTTIRNALASLSNKP